MIDAATFAHSYNAFWNDCAPTCEHFVRRLNLGGLKRFGSKMAKSDTSRRALIAEFAFSLFVERKTDALTRGTKRTIEDIEEAAWRATETRLAPYVMQGLNLGRDFDMDQRQEVISISKALSNFFANIDYQIVLRPLFSGCGYIDRSEGDVLFGDTIYEIKTVERSFRGNDIKQAITYAALNHASGQFSIENIGLFNPRSGRYCEIPIESVCREISGRTAHELLASIIQAISSGEVSR